MNKRIERVAEILSLKQVSVKHKFVIYYSVLMIAFVTILSTYAYANSVKILRDKSIGYTLGIIEQIRNNIDISLSQIDLTTYLVFANRDIQDILKNTQAYFTASDSSKKYTIDKLLTDVVFSRRDIHSISLFDKEGNRIDTNFTRPDIGFDVISAKADELDGKIAWLPYSKSVSIIPAVRQIRDMEMHLLGYMEINIFESSISKICSNQLLNMEGNVYVVNRNGIIMSGNDTSLLGQSMNGDIKSQLVVGKSGYFIEDIAGKSTIVMYYPSRVNDWQFVGMIPMASLTKDTAYLRNIIFLSSLITIALFIFFSHFISVSLTGPLKQITEQMKKAKIRDWSPQINYKGRDEIAFLTMEFNSMVLRMNSLVDKVIEQKSYLNIQEMKALQSQINPHFLYNTLEIVNWMARARNAKEIVDIVLALSDMMRYITSHAEDIVTVEKELEYVRKYCLLQHARYLDKFSVEYDVDEDVLDCSVPKLSLQPIIENAILHAFDGMKNGGEIHITGKVYDKKIRLQIIDNGKGIDPETIRRMMDQQPIPNGTHVGIGVGNVDRRIKLIFGTEYGLKIISVPDHGSSFDIWLPLTYLREDENE